MKILGLDEALEINRPAVFNYFYPHHTRGLQHIPIAQNGSDTWIIGGREDGKVVEGGSLVASDV